MFKFPFIPRGVEFFDLFEEGAQNMAKAAQKLKAMVDTWENIEQKVNEISELEHHGDNIIHRIMDRLHRTFITTFDREDIAILAKSLDDVTDFIQAAADAMLVYKVDSPSQRAKELADIIVQATAEVGEAISKLRHRIEPEEILPRCVEINRLENAADRVFRSALGELFNDITDIVYIIKWREIYEHMESATDRCEDVANILEGVALKNG